MTLLQRPRSPLCAGKEKTESLPGFFAILLGLLVVAIFFEGCSPPRPAPFYGWNWSGPAPEGYYLVREGDSLSQIAERLELDPTRLARWNRLDPPYRIYADTLLRIKPPNGLPPPIPPGRFVTREPTPAKPGGEGRASVASVPERKRGHSSPRADIAEQGGGRPETSGVTWSWPITGPLIQTFQEGDRTRQGLRIGARAGDRVKAAAAGKVVYSGSGLKGYGKLIIVKHNDKYLSAYGFNRRLLVTQGERVKRGQVVAEVGQGAKGIYLLHFEVRRAGKAVDPILYLPTRN